MEVNIHSVARKANVSISTVSRILNGSFKGKRSDANKRAKLVLEAARELGYQPNPTARGLVMKRSFTIGFVGTELDNPVRGKLIETLRGAAREKDYNLLVSGIVKGSDDVVRVLKYMEAQRVDGVVLGNIQQDVLRKLSKINTRNMHIVGFGQEVDLPWDSVLIDYSRMLKKLVEHLIVQHGFRKIVYVSASGDDSRVEGYKCQMRESGLEEYIDHWRPENYTMEEGKRIVQTNIRPESLPQAIVCHNDMVATGLIAGLRSMNLSVPGDIAVTGFDDVDISSYMNPTLTTAGVDSSELALKLFNLLQERMSGEREGDPVQLRCHENLFFRESCGCTEESKLTLNE